MKQAETNSPVKLADRARDLIPYSPPVPDASIDLHLDANEATVTALDLRAIAASLPADAAYRYPSPRKLEQAIAEKLNVDPARVIATAGGDDAIDRACRVSLQPGREIVCTTPTFEMIARFARLAGADVVSLPWLEGKYPIDAVLASITPRTSMIAVVSPNNPTGTIVDRSDLERLSSAAPHALLLVDLAYTEFADVDLTADALALPNAVIVRTFSKAFGLAGLRVGYAAGPQVVIRAMRAVDGPYAVSAIASAAALECLGRPEHIAALSARIRIERAELSRVLTELGATVVPSQANFVFARFTNAESVWKKLAESGIAVRRFSSGAGLENALRITCPGNEIHFERLTRAILAACAQQNGKRL